MATNVNNAHGLNFVRRIGGGPEEVKVPTPGPGPTFGLTDGYNKLVGYGTAIFINDVVYQVAGDATFGRVIQAWGSATPGTTAPLGVSKSYGALSTASVHAVNVDYLSVFEVQDNGSTAGFTAVKETENANVSQDAGNTTTKISGQQLTETSFGSSAATDVHMIGLFPDPTNVYGINARVEVIFNHHKFHPNTVAV